MPERPPIPSELRRAILTEARHHCAVCGYPSVDVHHIVAWTECQEHNAENLLALCQNCHRRADRREIDAASLRVYKAALPNRRLYEVKGGASSRIDSTEARWVVHRIQEQVTHPKPFELNLEFPQFIPDSDELATLNGIERARALEQLHEMRRLTLLGPPADDEPWSKMKTVAIQSFEVTLLTTELVSYRYETYRFNPGAAHGNTATEARTLRLNPLVRLGLEEAFVNQQQLTTLLSKECVGSLEAEGGRNLSTSLRHLRREITD